MKADAFWKKRILDHEPRIYSLGEQRGCSVLIPLLEKEGEKQVLFEVRANLNQQPGDICLPGGMQEKCETPLEAALRECSEELLLSKENISVLGRGDIFLNGNLCIHSFAAELKNYTGSFNQEVKEVFMVPLSFFVQTEPKKYLVERRAEPAADFPYENIQGGRNYKWRSYKTDVYFYQWQERTIWGITANIMRSFARQLKEG